MKLKNIIFVLVYMLGVGCLQAHTINPMEDFSYPESLFQSVHEGIVHCMYMIKNHQHDSKMVEDVFHSLHDMQDQCDVAYRYNHASLKEEDADFLVSMIDKLEELVGDFHLAHNAGFDLHDACESLRMKLMKKS